MDVNNRGLDVFAGITPPPTPTPAYWPDITIGSLLKRKDVHADAVWHFGIKFDALSIVHIDKDRQTGLVDFRRDTFEGFAAGRQVFVDQFAHAGAVDSRTIHERAVAVRRSRAAFGLLSIGPAWNCEDVARFLGTGEKRSMQAEAGLAIAAIAAGVLYLLAQKG